MRAKQKQKHQQKDSKDNVEEISQKVENTFF